MEAMTTRSAQIRIGGSRRGRARLVGLGLAGSLLIAACTSDSGTSGPTTSTAGTSSTSTNGSTTGTATTGTGTSGTVTNGTTTGTDDDPDHTGALLIKGVKLSEGHSTADAAQPVPLVDGTPLDDATIDQVEARLPVWTLEDLLTKPFNWPTQSRPVPIAGATVPVDFPAADDSPPPEVPVGDLHVLRMQPEGAVDIAPFVSITFDQPMVPVATVGQLAAADVPATITPDLAGRWQWIGTNTLRFDATSDVIDRLPMATDYTVEVPAGTTSATGGVLADAVTFQFSTPSVTVQSFGPTGESLPLSPIFIATFDQRVDAQAVLDSIVVAAGDQQTPMRLVDADELAADDTYGGSVGALPDGRWIAFRPVDPFPPATDIEIAIGPGTPSAEGPVTTTDPTTYGGRTYEPLQVVSADCSYSPECPPPSDIIITLNNALDTDLFDPATIQVDPAIPGMVIGAYGNSISIHGATQGRTTYTVTIPAGLTDVYGQQLGQTETRTVEIGEAAPILQQFAQPFTTLDPLAEHPTLPVVTVNHDDFRLRVFAVSPQDWAAYPLYLQSIYNGDTQAPEPSWTALDDRVIDVDAKPDQAVETSVDLSEYLQGNLGHIVVLVETTEHYSVEDRDYWTNRPTITWAQATSIGLDAFVDATSLHAWATNLGDGAPLAGVDISVLDQSGLGGSGSATTDADGLASIDLGSGTGSALVATSGADTALLPDGFYGETWQRQPLDDRPIWYVFDDRQVYKPGETVSIKGWVRRLTSSSDSQLELLAQGAKLDYTANDSQGNVLASGQVDVNPLGGFDFTFEVPADANLGYSYVQLGLSGVDALPYNAFTHNFQIEEFRRPEFEVGARNESAGPYVQGSPLTLAVDANYYSGGPLGAAPVDWSVTTASATYSPPGWNEFTFGRWTPWWYSDFGYSDFGGDYAPSYQPCCDGGQDSNTAQFTGVTDGDGTHYLQVDVGSIDDPALAGLPVAVTAQATVTDVNRQALASTTTALVHPVDFYVGLRGKNTFVERGKPLDIDAIVTDIDGAVAPGRAVHVTATRSESTYEHGEYVTNQVDPQTCDITSGADPVKCSFTTTVGGEYTITATVTDDQGRTSRTELTRWVSGEVTPPTRNVEQQLLTIVPDQESYAPGTSAQLLVQAPFATGDGLLTVARDNKILSTIRFEVADGSAIVEVPIADADIPGLDISIEVVGATPRAADDGSPLPDAPLRPAFATGGLSLAVSTATRTLDVTATPQADTVAPGADTAIDVTVNDANGQPVEGSELAVVVVDEAVLALSGYTLDDPLATFYGQLPTYLSTQYGRSSIILTNPLDLSEPQGGSTTEASADTTETTAAASATTTVPGLDSGYSDDKAAAGAAPAASPDVSVGDGTDNSGNPIEVRTDFDALAVWEPSVITDADGHATIDVPLPDNLTRYRVMVVAVAGADQFGSDESNITARLPLQVRPSAPRFLNFGDVFELPVVVQNQTDADMTVDLVLQTENLDIAPGGAGKEVVVPANDRVEVRFPVSAAEAGTARFRVAGVSGDAADAATIELPVYTPATAEAFATYGVLDDGSTLQPVSAPTDVFPQFGGLDITTSSTSLQALTDAVLYLSEYPYETSDAMASRILAISSLRDVLDAFDAPGLPSPDALNAAVKADIDRLVALQNDDGGFPYWEHGRESDPYNSIQATHALVIAKADGFAVPDFTIQSATAFLTNIEQYILDRYNEQATDSLSAYALNVRMLAGDRDSAKAQGLFDQRGEDLPLDAIAWLWPVIDDKATSAKIEKIIQNKVVDTAGAVTFTTAVTDDDYVTLRSDRRTDGLILDDLIALTPKSDLIPKVVTGLLAAQSQGRWDNVQENSFILLAMKRYFDTFESQTPEFVARVWLGDRFAGEHPFSGRSTDRAVLEIPTADLIANGDANLTISKEGTGRLYYRIGLRTAPTNLDLDPLDRGFVVARTYEGVDDPNDVSRDADGTWHFKAGARIRVRLTMVAESQRTHVALIDPLPAGLEILNPELATTPDVPVDPNQGGGGCGFEGDFGGDCPVYSTVADYYPWYLTWFDHQNLRDDRAEAFSNYLSAGTYDYTYVARATTPGSFVVPPVRAEEMYAPETFGRGATDKVVVDG
jgi:alpha-2-macroglobulin